jgi:putative phosphoribosyl transferase
LNSPALFIYGTFSGTSLTFSGLFSRIRISNQLKEGIMLFHDRRDAGKRLAGKLTKYADQRDLVILGLPRGGVPVAFEVATTLHAPLDVFIVRKIGFPGQPEFAIGAIASGVCILNRPLIDAYQIPMDIVNKTIAEEKIELERRELTYLPGRNLSHLPWKNVILIDDGLATGATMNAGVMALRKAGCEHLVVGVPVGAADICETFRKHVDEIVCDETPPNLSSVGQWYEDFSQTTDDEVRQLLQISRASFNDEVA